MAIPADDPARAKYAELMASGATKEEIVDQMETYEVGCKFLVKGLSPGHAKAVISELANHMIEVHLDPGLGAVSSVEEPVQQQWLDGPLFGGELNG